MPAIPDDRSYTEDHEWVMIDPGADLPSGPVRVGITEVATEALGELVFAELPAVGDTVTAGQPCGELESTKTVSEIFPPVSGKVAEVNQSLDDAPQTVTDDPYGAGWLFSVEPTDAAELLTSAQYAEKNSIDE